MRILLLALTLRSPYATASPAVVSSTHESGPGCSSNGPYNVAVKLPSSPWSLTVAASVTDSPSCATRVPVFVVTSVDTDGGDTRTLNISADSPQACVVVAESDARVKLARNTYQASTPHALGGARTVNRCRPSPDTDRRHVLPAFRLPVVHDPEPGRVRNGPYNLTVNDPPAPASVNVTVSVTVSPADTRLGEADVATCGSGSFTVSPPDVVSPFDSPRITRCENLVAAGLNRGSLATRAHPRGADRPTLNVNRASFSIVPDTVKYPLASVVPDNGDVNLTAFPTDVA